MEYTALIVAAGSGTRMGLGYNKVYAPLTDGQPMLFHTMKVFQDDPDCHQLVIVTDSWAFLEHWHDVLPHDTVFVHGGNSRRESVRRGLTAVKYPVVFVHDGARPYVDRRSIEALKEAMKTEQAALLMVPCKDTIKVVKDGYVEKTLDRSTLQAAQTPQAFATDLLMSCLDQAAADGFEVTDDASAVEKYGHVRVRAVSGSYANFKITTPEDLR
jgi:2-C-methyl-D-erythritol 4-phosphate cytidylyltransferase